MNARYSKHQASQHRQPRALGAKKFHQLGATKRLCCKFIIFFKFLFF